jgi:hypothetical protein
MHHSPTPVDPHGQLPVLLFGLGAITLGAAAITFREALAEQFRAGWDAMPSHVTKALFFGASTSDRRQELLEMPYLFGGLLFIVGGVFLVALFFT